MSTFNDDKKAARRRSSKLQNVEAEQRDQIPSDLVSKLKKLNVVQRVEDAWRAGDSNRRDWMERQRKYLDSWDEFLVANSEGPFEHSTNLHLPMPFIAAKTYHARFLQAITGNDSFGLEARRADSIEKASTVEQFMKYGLQEWVNGRNGIDETLDIWLWQWITTGVGIKKWRWDVKYTRYMDVIQRTAPSTPQIKVKEDGTEEVISKFKQVQEEIAKTKKVFEGPECEAVDPEDVVFLGGNGDLHKADSVMHRQYLTASDLWTFADRKVFDERAVKKVIEGGGDQIGIDGNLKQDKARNAGKSDLNQDQDLDRYEIVEAYLSMDVDGSGINSEIVVWVHFRSKTLLRATYLHRISKSGERPFVKIDFHKRPGEDYGIGLIETLYPLSKELDMIHNMRVDYGLLSTMPFGFYRATSGIDPETIKLEPGSLIPVNDPSRDVFFPVLGNRAQFGFQEEGALQAMVERLTGLSDITLGVVSGSQGAARTATGARALIGEANANLDVHLKRLNRGWKKSLEIYLHILQQRTPMGFSFRVTGEDGKKYWRDIKAREDIAGDFDFAVMPSSADSNPIVRRQKAQELLQLTSNPLYIQLGIVSPRNVYEAMKTHMDALGIKDFSRYIQKPQEGQIILEPEEEINRVLRGQDIQVVPQMDHEAFLALYESLIEDVDTLVTQFGESNVFRLGSQAQQHRQMQQALAAAQAQSANIQQMRQNEALASDVGQPGGVSSVEAQSQTEQRRSG